MIKSVLIIDDSPADQLLSLMTIEQYDPNIRVLQAYDGREGLDLLASEATPPDVILLDINMPGMNGHEFLEEYSTQLSSSCVVIMLTSSELNQDKQKCMEYSFVKHYFSKLLEQEDLEKLAELL